MGIYGQDADDEDVLGDHKRYLVQSWSGGTMCDKTGVQRRIEVQVNGVSVRQRSALWLTSLCSSFTATPNPLIASF